MGPTFSTILNEFWTDFFQFSAKDGGGVAPHPPTHTPPNVRPCSHKVFVTRNMIFEFFCYDVNIYDFIVQRFGFSLSCFSNICRSVCGCNRDWVTFLCLMFTVSLAKLTVFSLNISCRVIIGRLAIWSGRDEGQLFLF